MGAGGGDTRGLGLLWAPPAQRLTGSPVLKLTLAQGHEKQGSEDGSEETPQRGGSRAGSGEARPELNLDDGPDSARREAVGSTPAAALPSNTGCRVPVLRPHRQS